VRTYLDCVPCFISQTLDAARRCANSGEIHERLLREALTLASTMSFDCPPPVMGRLIHRRLRELAGQADPYRLAKQEANEFALRLYRDLKKLIIGSRDPLAAAVRFAIAGNVIDLGVKTGLTEGDVRSAIAEAVEGHVDSDAVEELRRTAMSAGDILYLVDNAGEIVFDRLLIEQMPPGSVTLVVKAGPIINDATREDAETAGLADIVEVIDNGDDAPGTILDSCSPSFRRRFDAAELIIAKGQGNYETLNECRHRNLFFLLKIKCAVIARDLGCGVGGMVVRKHKAVLENPVTDSGDDFDWLAEEAHS
jgi:damage-control phosphatase, subfamily I